MTSRGECQCDTVRFHRHCQATVLSAFGLSENDDGEGTGNTWRTLSDLSLPHLDEMV